MIRSKNLVQTFIAGLSPRWQITLFSAIGYFRRRKAVTTKFKERAPADYLAFNRKALRVSVGDTVDLILFDCFPVPEWLLAHSVFLTTLAQKVSANIASFGFQPRPRELDEICSSFGADRHLLVELDAEQKARRNSLYCELLDAVTTRDDLINYQIDGVWVGLDIYESILRIGTPTVNIEDYYTKIISFEALTYYVYFSDLIRSGNVKAVCLSHDCYYQMGTVVKIAQRYDVPTYFVNAFEMIRSYRTHDTYEKFRRYPEYFHAIDKEQQDLLIRRAREALQKRLSGTVGAGMSYQLKSAFLDSSLARQTSTSNKLKVVVATHCFFDNPHAYSRMTFRDFHEWLDFLGGISEITDYDWHIKPHRDFLPGTMEILENFALRYPRFRLIDPETSFHQLKREGVSVALTCYGSVGHELPLLGINVVNASYNPHIAYEFNTHCATQDEYRAVLMELDKLPPPQHVERIYEFYAVHHYVVRSDSLLFPSYAEFDRLVQAARSPAESYSLFLRSGEDSVIRYRRYAEAFLADNFRYEFELRLSERRINVV